MKRSDLPKFLPLAAVLAGVGAMFARLALYSTAVDATGRIAAGHPLSWTLGILSAAVAVLCLLALEPGKGSALYADNFSKSFHACVGHIAFAYGVLMTVVRNEPIMPGVLGRVWTCLGYASAPCLVIMGLARLKGQQPSVLFCLAPPLYLTAHLINHYQLWCSDPQLQDVAFPLFATIALIVVAYQQAAFAADMGSRRQLQLAGTLALYLCLGELAVSGYGLLYTTGMFWAATALCDQKGV